MLILVHVCHATLRLLFSKTQTKEITLICGLPPTHRSFNDVNDVIILLLYVDDMLVVGPNKYRVHELKAQLVREFNTKDLRLANKILGMQIHKRQEDLTFLNELSKESLVALQHARL
jgi:hypothetical protein